MGTVGFMYVFTHICTHPHTDTHIHNNNSPNGHQFESEWEAGKAREGLEGRKVMKEMM